MKWLQVKDKCVFATKNERLCFNQITWCNLLPTFIVFTCQDKQKRFAPITAITFGWLFWEVVFTTLNLYDGGSN